MVNIKKKSWNEVTLSEYDRITEICKDDALSDAEKDIALIAILAEVPEDEVWNMSVDDVKRLKADMLFLSNNTVSTRNTKYKKIKFGEWECNVLQDLQKMTYAQFVDFQTYIKDLDNKKAEVLSVFFIPVGHKYGDGYDIAALQQAISDNVSVAVYRDVWFFFLTRYTASLNHTALCLASMLKARSWMMKKSNPLKAKYKELARIIRGIPKLMYG